MAGPPRPAQELNRDRSRHRRCRPHPDRPGPQGLARRRRRIPPGARSRSARPSSAPASTPPTSTTSCSPSRCRAAACIARNVAVRLGLTEVPGMADNRHCAAGLSAVQIARRQHPGRHGPGRRRRRHREPQHVAADVEGARAGRRAPDVDVAQPSRDPRRADVRHVDHGGREHGPRDGAHPARRRRVGGVQPRPCHRVHRLRLRSKRRSCPSSTPTAMATPACSASTSIPGRGTTVETLADAQAPAPRDRRRDRHRRQRGRASTTPPPRSW